MSRVSFTVAGRSYDLVVRDGQEAHFTALAERVDARARDAVAGAGGLTEARQLLFAALLLADDVQEARAAAQAAAAELAALRAAVPDPGAVRAIEALAARLEAYADGLEKHAAAS